MPQIIVHQDPSGLAEGIETAGSALAQALGQRAQESRTQAQQRRHGTILGQILGALPENASPMKVSQALTHAIGAHGVPVDMAQKYASIYTTLQKAQADAPPGAVKALLADSDFSTIEGQRTFFGNAVQYMSTSDALKIIDEFKPSGVAEFVSRYPTQQPITQPAAPIPEEQLVERPIPLPEEPVPEAIPPVEPGIEEPPVERPTPLEAAAPIVEPRIGHPLPAKEGTPFGQIPERDLIAAMGSKDKQVAELAKGELEARDRNRKQSNEDRKYHTSRSRKYVEDIDARRSKTRSKRAALEGMKWAIKNRDFSMFKKDWWAERLGVWGTGLVTPEGAFLSTNIKEFLLGDLGRITGRPNMFIEQRILAMLPGIGKEVESNMAMAAAVEMQLDLEERETEAMDRLTDEYERTLGYVPGNIAKLVDQDMRPYAQQAEEKLAYSLRSIQEQDQGVRKLSTKKPPPGTPLTLEMSRYFLGKNQGNKDKVNEIARKLGYTIPSEDDYKRYLKK